VKTEFRSSALTQWFQETYGRVDLRIKPIRSGLSAVVAQVSARNANGGRDLFIIKKIPPLPTAEHSAYKTVALRGLEDNAPRLIAAIPTDGGTYLVLEYVMRWCTWPWREIKYAGLVLDTLAAVHGSSTTGSHDPNYDDELAQLAEESVRVLDSAARQLGDSRLQQGRAFLRRWAADLNRTRAELLADHVFIHGDVHPGNVRIRMCGEAKRAVLLDWGRARQGSRFEDVASWLQSLRFWEPQAARRHDLLFGQYLRCSGLAASITHEHRRAYWLAAGSNAVGGALIVHLTSAISAQTDYAQQLSIAAAIDWLRIVRRALYYRNLPKHCRFGTA
jgi:aminoglycoside phosphotransferase (APT) family kinase protein